HRAARCSGVPAEHRTVVRRTAHPRLAAQRRGAPVRTFVLALIALFAVACGGSADAKGPERTDLKVGGLPTWDAAAVYLAASLGYFKDEGLKVTPVVLANSEEAVSRNLSGAVDITHDGYVSPILAASKGLKLKIIVDSARAKRGMYVIIAPGTSAIHG